MKILNCNFVFSSIFSLFLVSCLVFSLKSLFLIFVFFSDFELCFLFNIIVFGFKTQVEKHNFSKKWVCNITVFFLSTCVLQNVKSYRFWGGIFFCKFLVVFEKTL